MVVRLFNVYYPRRILILLASDLFLVCASLLLGILLNYGHDSFVVLTYKHGLEKVVVITVLGLLLSHSFDLYKPGNLLPPSCRPWGAFHYSRHRGVFVS